MYRRGLEVVILLQLESQGTVPICVGQSVAADESRTNPAFLPMEAVPVCGVDGATLELRFTALLDEGMHDGTNGEGKYVSQQSTGIDIWWCAGLFALYFWTRPSML